MKTNSRKAKFDTRQLTLPGCELKDYVAESIGFLRKHEPSEGYFVGFSGGKDSITALELCRMAGVKYEAYYSCTRIDPPEVMRFIKTEYPDVKWLFSKKSFWQMIVDKQPPMRHMRWCCDELKKRPTKDIPLNHRIMGIRAEESFSRAKYPRIDRYSKKKSQILYKPIFYWPEWAVWEFIEANNLKYPILYDEGFHRIGCVVCPFILGSNPGAIRQKEMSQKRWPGIWKVFECVVKRWFNTHSEGGLRASQKIKTDDEFWDLYIRGGLT